MIKFEKLSVKNTDLTDRIMALYELKKAGVKVEMVNKPQTKGDLWKTLIYT